MCPGGQPDSFCGGNGNGYPKKTYCIKQHEVLQTIGQNSGHALFPGGFQCQIPPFLKAACALTEHCRFLFVTHLLELVAVEPDAA